MATSAGFIKEKWADIQRAIRERWSHEISDADLAKIVPDHAALCDLIGSRCELTAREARREVDRLLDEASRGMPY